MPADIYQVRVEALGSVWRGWAEVGAGLDDDEWDRKSRCDGWAVSSLFAHHSVFPLALAVPLTSESENDDAVVASAVDVLRKYNQPGGVAHTMAAAVADRAIEEAGSFNHEDLVARFAVVAPRAIETVSAVEPGLRVPWPATSSLIPMVEALRIVLMEATVHLLDVLDALGQQPDLPDVALHETADLLAEMVDPVTLIEMATGRSVKTVTPVLR